MSNKDNIYVSLILEGGGMRGAYTAGVLDFFLENNIEFSSCYGVSAGAAHCCSFLSKQKKRAYDVSTKYLKNKNYASLYSFIKTGDYFGKDFVYNTIPNELDLYDYEAFSKYSGKFYAVVTNFDDGKAEYIEVTDLKKDMEVVRASCSLPFISHKVMINNKYYFDGGIADSIPIKRSIADGNNKNVIILTRDEHYQKKQSTISNLAKIIYKNNKAFVKALLNRYKVYNETLAFIKKEEESGNIFVIRPKQEVTIGRLEKNEESLRILYQNGYDDAKDCYEDLKKYLLN